MLKVLKNHWVLFTFTGLWGFLLMSPVPAGITIWLGWGLFLFYLAAFTGAKPCSDWQRVRKDTGPGDGYICSLHNSTGEGISRSYED